MGKREQQIVDYFRDNPARFEKLGQQMLQMADAVWDERVHESVKFWHQQTADGLIALAKLMKMNPPKA